VRHHVLVLTFVVIVVTLVAQGLTLPLVVRALGLDRVGARQSRERRRREIEARIEVVGTGLARLEAACREQNLPREVVAAWGTRHRQRIAQLEAALDPRTDDYALARALREIELSMVGAQREKLNELVRAGSIDDETRRRIERDLDLDEERQRRNIRGLTGGQLEDTELPPRS
jgi:CPA1 family monovalent cation:H+ antiporter